MALIGNLVVNILAKTAQFDKGLKKIRRRLRSFQRSMRPITKILGNIFRSTVRMVKWAAFAIGAATVAIIGYAASFEKTMSRVRALTGATAREFDALRESAIELGEKTVFTAKQAAEGMSFFALAGFEVTKIIKAMPATLNLAAAAQIGLAEAADIAAKIMAGMRIDADGLNATVDILAKAFTTANTNMVQLGEGMSFVGPVANSLGLTLGQTAAALQVLANASFQGEKGGTGLRNILARLSGGIPQASRKLKDLGVQTVSATGEFIPLADIIDQMNDRLATLSGKAARTGLIMNIFGQRAGPQMTALLAASGDELRRFEKQLENAGGTAEKIARIQLDNLAGVFTKLKSIIGTVSIELGTIFIPNVRKTAQAVRDWIDDNKQRIIDFGGVIHDHLIATIEVLTGKFTTLDKDGSTSINNLTVALSGAAKILALIGDTTAAIIIGLKTVAGIIAIAIGAILVPIQIVLAGIIGMLNLIPGIKVDVPAAVFVPTEIIKGGAKAIGESATAAFSQQSFTEQLDQALKDIAIRAGEIKKERIASEHERRMEKLAEDQLAGIQQIANPAFAE